MSGNKINTNKEKINELLTKGVDEVIEVENLRVRLLKGEQLRVKLGIDPTSSNIHLGRAIILWKLRQFQDLGHKAVFIVGDFTGQIGDTSDKESERPMLSEKEVQENLKTYFDQAYKILDKDNTETHYNSEWLNKINFLEICRMADNFGLHEITARELIKKRLNAGKRVSLREVLYPLMQGYDSVAVKADVELGGTDQRFNLLAGRTIQPVYEQKPQDIVIMKFPLLGLDGRKMSSSWGNVVNITDEPNDMFGKIMSINDELIIHYFEMATQISEEEILQIREDFKADKNPKNLKLKLAFEIVKLYHGEEEAKKAQGEFERVFSKKELPEDIKEWHPEEGKSDTVGTMVNSGLVESRAEAKRLIDQKAVSINDKVIKDWGHILKSGDIIKVGPRKFLKIK